MSNLKETRNRITSIRSTMQITSAMKMVSAAKLKRATDAVVQMRPYAEKLQEILVNVSAGEGVEEIAYAQQRKVEKVLFVVFTSNRGLCGGFNANAMKEAVRSATADFAGQNVDILAVGKKGGEALVHRGYNLIESHQEVYNELTFETVSAISEKVMKSFIDGEYDHIRLIYNSFKNAATQIVQNEQFLPIEAKEQEGDVAVGDYIYEPNKSQILVDLVPKSLKTQFYKAILDSVAGEHGARMTAMHKATDNATELAKELTLMYNKARQAAITNEILEIVGGAEALNN